MIKIPEKKYNQVCEIHYKNIKYYLKESIQFYINCCDILDGQPIENLDSGITCYNNENSFYSLLSVISNRVKTRKKKRIPLKDIFHNEIKKEFKKNYKSYRKILDELLNKSGKIYIKDIITSKPEELESIHNYLSSNFNNIKSNAGEVVIEKNVIRKGLFHDMISKIFNYERLIEDGYKIAPVQKTKYWDAYSLCGELDIKVCPYCNRIYTFTVQKEKDKVSVRPSLDHYMPKSKFPFFAISFYNLIPSCTICNSSIKGDKYLSTSEYLHPYIDGIHKDCKFDFTPDDICAFDGDKRKIDVIIINKDTDNKTKNTIKHFGLESIYKGHTDIVAELIMKRKRYPKEAISQIAGLFGVKDEIIFNSIFGVHDESEIIDVSLGKLKNDIVEKLRYK
jgi:hypothetical protein